MEEEAGENQEIKFVDLTPPDWKNRWRVDPLAFAIFLGCLLVWLIIFALTVFH